MTMGTEPLRDNSMRLHGTGARPEQELGLRSTGETICVELSLCLKLEAVISLSLGSWPIT